MLGTTKRATSQAPASMTGAGARPSAARTSAKIVGNRVAEGLELTVRRLRGVLGACQCFLSLFDVSHVARDRIKGAGLRRDGPREPTVGAVQTAITSLEAESGDSVGQLLDLSHRRGLVIRVYEVHERTGEQLLSAVAEDVEGRADALEMPVHARDAHHVERKREEALEHRALTSQFDVRADTGEKLASGEGLHEIVVRAALQSFDRGFFTCPRRQKDHGDIVNGRVGTQRSEESEAIEVRHHHIAEDESRLAKSRGLERGEPVVGHLDGVMRTQDASDVVAQVCIVVDHEDARGRL